MAGATIQREATRLLANHTITTRLLQLRSQAAEKAVLDKAWVLDKLRKNIEVSLGEQTLTLKVQKRDKETGAVEVVEVEVSAHDAAAANRGLELLAKHLGLFELDNQQAGAAAVVGKEWTEIEVARRIAWIMGRALRHQDDKTNAPPVGQQGDRSDGRAIN